MRRYWTQLALEISLVPRVADERRKEIGQRVERKIVKKTGREQRLL